ncbi:MAG TPA: hypothetical protein VJP89_05610 [Pyrinomonadaceae bacterium]|nr:hypothetical protein [Pyrinomonadaceae bacterium]
MPSIWVPGQFLRKNVASAQDVIWEQCVRPSHRYGDETRGSGVAVTTVGTESSGSVSLAVGANARGSRLLFADAGVVARGSGVVLASTGAVCGSVI